MKNNKLKIFGKSFLSAMLGVACLTGCTDGKNGKQGVAGTNGTTWYTGVDDPTSSLGGVGDFYLETDDGDVWRKETTGWIVISNIKGPEGEQGPTGNPAKNIEYRNNGTHIQWRYVGETTWTDLVALEDIKGEDGKDGISVYIGYDGYVWNGKEKTSLQVEKLGNNVTENTLELKGNVYFEESVIAAGTKVALMMHYQPTAKMTIYSDSIVDKLTTYVSAAGKLDIGVVDLKTGAYTLKVTKDVVAGKNEIDLDLELGENETLVLGGTNTTVDMYKIKGVEGNDTYGVHTTDLEEFGISKTGTTIDKLVVNVEIKLNKEVSVPLFETITTDYPNSSISSMAPVEDDAAPFAYKDKTLFAGKRITKFGIAVKDILDASDAFVTLYVIKTSTVKNFETNAVRTVKLKLPANAEENTWVYVDCDIQLAEDEYFAIGAPTGDTVDWGFTKTKTKAEYEFLINSGNDGGCNLLFDIYVADSENKTIEEHLNEIKAKEEEAIIEENKAKLVLALEAAGINHFSILGDSISTFGGVSNDATNTNSTIGSNAVFYSGSNWGITSADQTWWKQTANEAGLNVLVNNSWSGDTVSGRGQTRATQLHDDTVTGTQTSVINPDLIAVYLGINDFNSYGPKLAAGTYEAINWETLIVENQDGSFTYGSASTFAEYYAIMMHKLTTAYDADVFCFTLLPNGQMGSRPITELEAFNEAIAKIAERFGCGVVDLYNDSGITTSNMSSYYADYSGQNLHPNQTGMDLITECFINKLIETYVK